MDAELRDKILDTIYYDELYVACYNLDSNHNVYTGFLNDGICTDYTSTLKVCFSYDGIEVCDPSSEIQLINWPKRVRDRIKQAVGSRYKGYHLIHCMSEYPDEEYVSISRSHNTPYNSDYVLKIYIE